MACSATHSNRSRGPGQLIEQEMYFALGALVAGLGMLLFLPVFWRRALRLSMRRLQAITPLSLEEITAERDLLRAQFAVREHRLEQEIAAIRASKAQDLVAIGRQAARVADLDGQLARAIAYGRDLEHRLQGAQKTLAERTELLSSAEAALLEVVERGDHVVAQARRLETDKVELGRQTEYHLGRVAAHEAKIAALHERASDLEGALANLREEHTVAAKEAARTPALDAAVDRLTKERNALAAANRALAADLDARCKALAEAERQAALQKQDFDRAQGAARTEAQAQADKLERTRADAAMASGAADALRRECAALRQEARAVAEKAALAGPGEGAFDAADIVALRADIVEMGKRMAELAGDQARIRSKVT